MQFYKYNAFPWSFDRIHEFIFRSGVHDKTLGYSSNDFTPAETVAMAQTQQQV